MHYDEHGESYHHETMRIYRNKKGLLLLDQVPATQAHIHCTNEQQKPNIRFIKEYNINCVFNIGFGIFIMQIYLVITAVVKF